MDEAVINHFHFEWGTPSVTPTTSHISTLLEDFFPRHKCSEECNGSTREVETFAKSCLQNEPTIKQNVGETGRQVLTVSLQTFGTFGSIEPLGVNP